MFSTFPSAEAKIAKCYTNSIDKHFGKMDAGVVDVTVDALQTVVECR